MRIHDIIERKLLEALTPKSLSIIDESDHHHNHTGADPHGASHFRLVIVSEHFKDMSQIARQRMVYALLAAELCDQIHALSMQALTPEEEAKACNP